MFRLKAKFNHALVSTAEFLRIAPKGMVQVHQMLIDTGIALIESGEQGLFTPMHMVVFQKPN
jgi:24-methylenesterol C-methyltransferase